MAISGVSSGSNAWTAQRPDATKIANDMFAKVDTSNQGYIDKASLQSALGTAAADSASDVDQLFSQIDSDQDGKITKQELADGVRQLADALDAQFNSSRIARAAGNQQLGGPDSAANSSTDAVDASAATASTKPTGGHRASSASSSGDSSASDSTSYEAADTNQDGTVSLQELVAYQASNPTTTTESDAQNSLNAVMKIVAQLTQTYGQFDQSVANAATNVNTISETA